MSQRPRAPHECKWPTQLSTTKLATGYLHWQPTLAILATYTGKCCAVLHVSAKFELLSSSPCTLSPDMLHGRPAAFALHAHFQIVSQGLTLLAQTMRRQQRSTEQGTVRC
jgi:hypothetical protein